jgi:glycosyltransferase involved in cell wall biosynthesis
MTRVWNDLHVFDVQHFTGGLDWFITSDWNEPPAGCKKATVIHDLAFMRYPETVAGNILNVQRRRISHVKRESDRIFADSNTTRADILELLHIPEEKVITNYPGIRSGTNDSGSVPPALSRPFILTVGKREPRKNLDRLIKAYEKVSPGMDLAIVGDRGWGDTPGAGRASKNIHFLGFVSDEALQALYKKCTFFIYPSIWEGFGYPVIEAMAQGAAVATSRTSSLGEIAGDSALLFDPLNIDSIAQAIKTLSSDEKKRKQLSERGRKHARTFTWERYYKTLIGSLK